MILEGDGLLALNTYEVINTVNSAIQADHLLNAESASDALSGGNTSTYQQLLKYAKSCVQGVPDSVLFKKIRRFLFDENGELYIYIYYIQKKNQVWCDIFKFIHLSTCIYVTVRLWI